jgi:hypothetical protein
LAQDTGCADANRVKIPSELLESLAG